MYNVSYGPVYCHTTLFVLLSSPHLHTSTPLHLCTSLPFLVRVPDRFRCCLPFIACLFIPVLYIISLSFVCAFPTPCTTPWRLCADGVSFAEGVSFLQLVFGDDISSTHCFDVLVIYPTIFQQSCLFILLYFSYHMQTWCLEYKITNFHRCFLFPITSPHPTFY